MKKILGGVLVLVLVCAAALTTWFLLRKPRVYRAEDLLPSQTIAFIDFPQAGLSRQRIAQSAIGRIVAEPEVKKFLKRPREAMEKEMKARGDAMVIFQEIMKALATAEGEAFVALTDVSISPRLDFGIVGGFDPGKNRKDADRAMEKLLERCRLEYPTAELVEHKAGSLSYKVWSPKRTVEIAFAKAGNFILFSYGEDPMKQVLDRASDGNPDSLSKSPLFTAHRERCKGSDAMMFVNPQAVFGRLQLLFAAKPELQTQLASVLAIQSFVGTTTMKGDAVESHTWMGIPPAAQGGMGFSDFKPCARDTLNAAGRDTLLYAVVSMDVAAWYDRTIASISRQGGGMVRQSIENFLVLLETRGIRLREDVLSQLGPEVALIMDWQGKTPLFSVVAQVKDPKQARGAFEKIFQFAQEQFAPPVTSMQPGMSAGDASTIVSIVPPQAGRPLSPSFTVTDQFLVLSQNRDGVENILQRLGGTQERLSARKEFQQCDARMPKGYYQFAYCDEKRLFESVYDSLHDVLWMMIKSPQFAQAAPYMDLAELPHTDTIARHLSPGVWASTVDAQGVHHDSCAPFDLPVLVFAVAQSELLNGGAGAMPR